MACTADVAGRGAVLLGEGVVADSFWPRPYRVVTHAHSDHTMGLSRSVRESLFIIATPTTFRFLEILGQKVPEAKRLELPYDRRIALEDEVLELKIARHIAGSSQVLVECRGGVVGYTGDFKMPGTPPMQGLDVLVIDATYGSPRLQRRWGEWDALAALVSLIEDNISRGPVWVYGYNGKLQEVMVELRRRGVTYPFIADEKTVKLARVAAEFYGYQLDDVRVYTGREHGESVVLFMHASRSRGKRRLPGTHIVLTGWELRAPAARVADNVYNVSFSDHATFREIVEYVREASPRMVVVDAYRGKDAWFTARYLERVLGIRSFARPVVGGGAGG
ncbi:MAG: MBL fold metallo-hydrolase [Desulfurococcales archaeon]|nr:MBL fold metallo-hydrolase [Desulfurococcales archaeon]